MRKRAGLARALAMDLKSCLWTTVVWSDPITAAGLDDLILSRDTLGMTIISDSRTGDAFQIADQMIVLDKGRMLVAGSPKRSEP
jgi:ABC-type transporter Mla maintaining outer membrane lipid asymmetry ATPase subunit MlaF